MKKIAPIAIALAVLAACTIAFFALNSGQSESSTKSPKSVKTALSDYDDEPENAEKNHKKKDGLFKLAIRDFFEAFSIEKKNKSAKSTLLIYMIGSDLESRSGAGTDELEEIEKSGIDLSENNVIVYAGGSQKWHNDAVKEDKNVILKLEKSGFKTVKELEQVNMGEPDSLSFFLNYCCENFPSQSYSLIMWDHGNGPIIGYGKDMLFDNDSLTLKEMQTALAASPFGNGKKLEWVGFDACLMSSAELACVFDDYAKYLVASQEIEPSFGWDYSFLKNFGKTQTVPLIESIVDGYLKNCNEYYEKKGYKNRDTTLACIDLSKAGELENAINDLFARADGDVKVKYNSLVVKRVETRALGRATTGSEYDLIDLYDMAEHLKEVYPEEAQKLCDTIEKAVIKNGTNTQGLSGISLYYPFYNKHYYEKSWGEAYSEIGLFANYRSYLNKYGEIWLKDDKLEKYASSLTPEKGESRSGFGTQEYTLKLTKEQNESFAEAKFYILQKMGDEMYLLMSTSNDVVNDNGILTARFSGKGIYAKDKYNDYTLPYSRIYDKIGNTTRYSIVAARSEGGIPTPEFRHFLIALDGGTEQVDIVSVTADNGRVDQDSLGGGKLEEVSMYDFDALGFFYYDYAYLTRYDNGTVKPLAEWIKKGAASMHSFFTKDGVEFEYSPLDDGQYCLMFEITDTQNNKYCSELLDIDVMYGEKKPAYKPDDINITWESGDKLKIYEAEGTVAYLKKTTFNNKPKYEFEAQNDNDYEIYYSIDDVTINDGVYIVDRRGYQVGTKEKNGGYLGVLESDQIKFGGIDEVYHISFVLNAHSYKAGCTLVKNQRINIDIKDGAIIKNLQEFYRMPELKEDFLGAHAPGQVIFENTDLKITLLEFGKEKDFSSYGYGIVCIENLSDTEEAVVSLSGIAVNGITIDSSLITVKVLPYCKIYKDFSVSKYTLTKNCISAVESLKIAVGLWKNKTWISGTVNMYWTQIELDRAGKETFFSAESNDVIFNKNDVKILLDSVENDGRKTRWNITIINDSDFDISVSTEDGIDIYIYYNEVGAHQRRNAQIEANDVESTEKTFDIFVKDFHKTKVLFQGDAPITLYNNIEEEEQENIELSWDSGDQIAVYEQENYTVFLNKTEFVGNPQYVFEVENRTPLEMTVEIDDIVINDNISYGHEVSLYPPAGGKSKSGHLITDVMNLDDSEDIKSISFTIDKKRINVLLSEETMIKDFKSFYKKREIDVPFMGALAKEQVLYKSEDIIIRLLGFGGYEQMVKFTSGTEKLESDYNYRICIENLSDEKKTVDLSAIAINDITISGYHYYDIPAGCRYYISIPLAYSYDHEKIIWFSYEECYNISDINSFKLAFIMDETVLWLPVKFDSVSENIYQFDDSGEVIFDESGVKVLLDSYAEEKERSVWTVSVINDNDFGVCLWLSNNDLTGNAANTKDMRVGPHQKAKYEIESKNYEIEEEITFKICILDFFESSSYFGTRPRECLYSSDELITLKAK